MGRKESNQTNKQTNIHLSHGVAPERDMEHSRTEQIIYLM